LEKNPTTLLNNIPYVRDKLFDIDNYSSATGDFIILEGTAVIIKRIMHQLLIKKGTYIFDPELGEDILQYLFEPLDTITYTNIQRTVNEVVNQNKGNVDVKGEVLAFPNKKGFRVNITVNSENKIKKVSIDVDESLLREN